MASLDTNIVLRLLLQDQPAQTKKIIGYIDAARPGSLQVADAVLFECAWVLSGDYYQLDRELVGRLLLQLTDIPQLQCNKALLERAVPRYVSNDQISFIDACLTAYAELNDGVPLMTFDRKLVAALPKLAATL